MKTERNRERVFQHRSVSAHNRDPATTEREFLKTATSKLTERNRDLKINIHRDLYPVVEEEYIARVSY